MQDLLIYVSRDGYGGEGSVDSDHAVELAAAAFLQELGSVGGGGLEGVCDVTQGSPGFMRAVLGSIPGCGYERERDVLVDVANQEDLGLVGVGAHGEVVMFPGL